VRDHRRDRAAAGRRVSDADEVSAYDRLVWPDGKIESWLLGNEHRRELVAYFGEPEYARLRSMAQAAAAVTQDPQRVVWYIPGIMGTQLALPHTHAAPDSLLWLAHTHHHHGRPQRL